MPFKAVLDVGSKSFPVRRFLLMVDRWVDTRGRPSSSPMWKLIVRLDAMSDMTLTGWMIDPDKELSGGIRIHKDGSESSFFKQIEFSGSSCLHMVDSFKSYTSYGVCEIAIMGGELKVQNMYWGRTERNA